jgi:hypothetical protein
MNEIKPKHLTWEKIRDFVEDLRTTYVNPRDLIPVPIEEIIEFQLNITVRPEWGLRERTDVEALLLADLKTIIVDNTLYYNKHYVKRIRFTLAHENRTLFFTLSRNKGI